MSDFETKKLDAEILNFIRRYSEKPSSDDAFNALALKLFAYQFERNPIYKRFCDMQGKRPKNVRHWSDIPAIPVAGFKDLVLASFPQKKAIKVFKTSGTTRGVEGRGAHFFDSLKLYECAILPPFKKFLLPDASSIDMRFLVAPPREAPDSSLSFMMGVVSKHFSSSGRFYVKKGKPLFEELARDLGELRGKTLILSTAFALKGFLDHLKEEKIRLKLPAGSRIMETGGFKGRTQEISKKGLHSLCRKFLGVSNIISEYGMTELSSQFYSQGFSKGFQGPAWTRTRAVGGLLTHWDLANRGSVMAVQTEDLGRVKNTRVFQLLGRAADVELRGCSLSYEDFIRQ